MNVGDRVVITQENIVSILDGFGIEFDRGVVTKYISGNGQDSHYDLEKKSPYEDELI